MRVCQVLLPLALTIQSNAQTEGYIDGERNPDLVAFDDTQLTPSSFFEQFSDEKDWTKVWKVSKAKKNGELYYTGEWAVEESDGVIGFTNDKSLILKTPSAHHAISAQLPQVFDNTNDTLVLQYEVKLDKGLRCGGAYIKLVDANVNYEEFSDATPFQVLFGPANCGPTNRVHLIIRHKDSKTGVVQENHLDVPPPARITDLSTLYTLIIKPTQDFEIRINGQVAKAGNLLEEYMFKPGFTPPKQIEDPDSTKPEDWEDEEYILDPEQATKPEDWDENAPYFISDPNAVKPETWVEEEPLYIPDPEATRPTEWNDEEDGIWIAPSVFNTKCLSHGCGPFKADKVVNPDYKGKWTQPSIENPNYKGEWSPAKIANPDYHEDVKPSNLQPIGAIGFELWSVDDEILFNNIYLGHSIQDAELIGNETFTNKTLWELRDKEATKRLREKAARRAAYSQLIPSKREEESWSEYLEEVGEILGEYIGDLIFDIVEDPVTVFNERYNELLYIFCFMVILGVSGFFFWNFVVDSLEYLLSTGQPMPSKDPRNLKEKKEELEDIAGQVKDSAKTTGFNGSESEVHRK